MADVVAFFGKNFTPNLITNKFFFSNKLIFWKNTIFEKSEKFIAIAWSITQILGIQGVQKIPGRLDISSGKIFFKKVKVIPELNFNEEYNGDLHFDLEVDLHGFLKVNFVFFNGNPFFLHLQSIEREILRWSTYPGHRSIVTLQVN